MGLGERVQLVSIERACQGGWGHTLRAKKVVIEGFQRREWQGQLCVLERSLARVGQNC